MYIYGNRRVQSMELIETAYKAIQKKYGLIEYIII